MAKLVIASLVIIFLVSLSSVSSNLGLADKWCVAKPSTEDEALKKQQAYACDNLNLKKTKSCAEAWQKDCKCPTLICKASWAMNAFYKSRQMADHECYFNNSGIVAITDPSYGNCSFALTK